MYLQNQKLLQFYSYIVVVNLQYKIKEKLSRSQAKFMSELLIG